MAQEQKAFQVFLLVTLNFAGYYRVQRALQDVLQWEWGDVSVCMGMCILVCKEMPMHGRQLFMYSPPE